jgi:hypothetical protein
MEPRAQHASLCLGVPGHISRDLYATARELEEGLLHHIFVGSVPAEQSLRVPEEAGFIPPHQLRESPRITASPSTQERAI